MIRQPDVDLDGDGLEQIELSSTNRVESCRDGDGTAIASDPVEHCALAIEMHDGFSVAHQFKARPARVSGFAP